MSYTGVQKLLHNIALSSSIMKEFAFDLERLLLRSRCNMNVDGQHIFISGLARSGTTILLNELHKSDQFSCLTYADMPFVMAPNIWDKMYGTFISKSQFQKERAHGDGITINLGSPEAFEEIFWKTFKDEKTHQLEVITLDDDIKQKFIWFVQAVLIKNNKRRYLSKNNINFLRLNSIREMFPNAIFLVPFRNPFQHAFSLLNQHKRFSSSQKKDAFITKYMNWLGHNEFGEGYQAFQNKQHIFLNPNELNHWLEQWHSVYSFIYKKVQYDSNNTLLINYDALCDAKQNIWQQLIKKININECDQPNFRLSEKEINETYDQCQLEKCMDLHSKLTELSENLLRNS